VPRRLASIDLGSNSALLLVAEVGDGGAVRRVEERLAVPRLGRGVEEGGRLDSKAAAAALRCLREFSAAAREHGVGEVHCVATAGLRDVAEDDRARFLRSAAAVGVRVRVIDGEEEAALSALAVARSLPELGDDLSVLDLGGRSMEVVTVAGGRVRERRSLPLGAVAVTERFLTSAPPPAEALAAARARVRSALAGLEPRPAGEPLAAVGGTATTLVAVLHAIDPYDPDRVHGAVVSRRELAGAVTLLSGLDPEELAALPGLPADRADIALAGALVLEETTAHLGLDELVVSDRGLRWGVVYSLV